ncbi:Rieske 2Fe-2S domain-containing protein [Nocardia sp. NPDC051832]|uniref:Rieske (2Fe-2S) protein n=1 Tax=Nocardia sp. NPDC051832 TaxID=3155673 RepID=UPI003413FD07
MSEASDDFRNLGPSAAVDDGNVVPFYLDDRKLRVSIARVGGALYAFDDLCTYDPCPLSSGLLEQVTLTCQCHGCQFDIGSGAVLAGPATQALPVHEVVEAQGRIRLRLIQNR